MPRRVNPIILLGLIIALILSLGVLAGAQLGGGTAGDALSVGEAQVGKPFMMATDGPNSFSCVGLMRYILRTIGVDGDAPWVPEAYLSKYAPVDPANLQPGDIVIFPGWATMYAGNGMLLNSNEALGSVTNTPMSEAGVPLGIVRPPYGGSQPLGGVTNPLTQPLNDAVGAVDPLAQPLNNAIGAVDPLAQQVSGVTDPILGTDPMAPASDPMAPAADPALATDPMAPATDPTLATDPMAPAYDPMLATDPMAPASYYLAAPATDPAAPATDPMAPAYDPLAQF